MTHRCPGGCGQDIPLAILTCRACWYRLPEQIRADIIQASRENDLAADKAARRAALTWYEENPR